MEDKLVEFETAKLAKEVGFDEWTNDVIVKDGTYASSLESFRNSEAKGALIDWIARPTQPLLQKWLRDVHNIKVIADSSTINMVKYWIDWYVTVNNHHVIDSRDGLDTYEQALEVGLLYALNLVKV